MKPHGREAARWVLLLCLIAAPAAGQDPETRVVAAGVLLEQAKDPARPAAARAEAFAGYDAAVRGVIDEPGHAGHPLRAVWRTDLAEAWLTVYLATLHRHADAFVEFGVPRASQREAFAVAVPMALRQLQAAEAELAALDLRLQRDENLYDQLDAAGQVDRLFDRYRAQKTAWYLARAAHLATLLPDDDPFWQQRDADASRQRDALRRRALVSLRPILDGEVGNDDLRRRAHAVAGRVVLAGGGPGAAEREHLAAAVSDGGAWTSQRLAAEIARALAREAGGDADAAERALVDLSGKSGLAGRLDDRLLVADALHRLRVRQGMSADEAYAGYFALLDDPDLEAAAGPLRNVLADRWAEAWFGGDAAVDLSGKPARARVVVADYLRRRGLLAQRRGGAGAGRRDLERALAVAETLDDRGAVGDAAWAAGRYQQAYATYALSPESVRAVVGAVTLATDVAERTPGEPVAADAVAFAAALGEALHRRHGGRDDVAAAYERVMAVLFGSGRYDTTPAADDRLLYYADTLLHGRGRYAEAVAVYERQLPSHPNYLAARTRRLAGLEAMWRAADASLDKRSLATDLIESSKRLEALAGQRLRSAADEAAREAAAEAAAVAQLARAEVFAARGEVGRALSLVDGLVESAGDRPATARLALRRRVLLLVQADRLDEAQAAAGTMMGRFPDAAAGLIDGVLSDLETRIDGLGEGDPRAARLADAAAAMAKLLADWAEGRGLDAAAMLPYRLVVLRSLRIADRPAEALAYLRDSGLERDHGDNAGVLYEKARALIGRGDDAALTEAAALLNRLIRGLREPYPDLYWQAWIARLEVMRQLDPAGGEAGRRVRQLARSHPQLGGEPFASRLRALGGAEAGGPGP
ncbi:MAG: hypothetical protein AAF800_11995 [Planctomycetota bacterium]